MRGRSLLSGRIRTKTQHGSINQSGYTLFPLPSCSKGGDHFSFRGIFIVSVGVDHRHRHRPLALSHVAAIDVFREDDSCCWGPQRLEYAE